jgi:hypothetical protein
MSLHDMPDEITELILRWASRRAESSQYVLYYYTANVTFPSAPGICRRATLPDLQYR